MTFRATGLGRALALCFFLATGGMVAAQETGNQAGGLPANGSFQGSDFDSVQLNNGNLHIEIPLYKLSGRGLGASVKYVYDNKGWTEKTLNSLEDTPVYVKAPNVCCGPGNLPPYHNMAWTVASPLSNGVGGGGQTTKQVCSLNGNFYNATMLNFFYKEPGGTTHEFVPIVSNFSSSTNPCNYPVPPATYSKDGAGYTFVVNQTTGTNELYAKDGTHFYRTLDANNNVNAVIEEDTNGNKLVRPVSSGIASSSLVDTLGRTLNTIPVLNMTTGNYELKYFDSTGATQTITIQMTAVQLHTSLCAAQNTGSSGPCNEYVGAWQAPGVITLPNGMRYVITYVQNSNGQIASFQLPTGATISYAYGSTAFHDLDDAGPKVTARTIVTDGQSSTWTYAYGGTITPALSTTTVRDPDGNETVHSFAFLHDGLDSEKRNWEVETDFYSGTATTGTRLKTVKTDYQDPLTQGPILPIHVTTIWNAQGGLTTRKEMDYFNSLVPNSWRYGWGNITEEREYDYGISTPTTTNWGSLLRKTDYQYAHLAGNVGYNVNYLNLGMTGLVTEKTVYDGSGTKVADAKIAYDGVTPTPIAGVPNHITPATGYRGNATQSSAWLNTTNTWLSTSKTYNDLGHVLTAIDSGGHTTQYGYADSWSGATCGVGSNTQAFPTQTTAPDTVNSQGATVHHRAQTSYYPCTGQRQSSRDENDILAGRTGTTYTFDSMLRPLTVTKADGGQTSFSYNDTPGAISVTSTEKQTASTNIVTASYHDALGRVKQTVLTDPEGNDKSDTTYDLMGRVQCASNPYRTTSDATYGKTCYQYDPLGRKTLEIPPDGTAGSNNVQTVYGGSTTGTLGLTAKVIDQAKHARQTYSDSLGRLIRVDEPDVASAGTAGTKSTGTVSISGTLQSGTSPGTPGTAVVYISGSEQSTVVTVCNPTCLDILKFDSGTITVTVNGHADGVQFFKTATTPYVATIISDLVAAINADSAASVTAVAAGASVYLTAKTGGTATNYSLSVAATSTLGLNSFAITAFSPTLTGGTNGGPVTDSGAVELTMGSFTMSVPYGSGSTASSVASALASALNGSFDSPATATVSGTTLTLTSRASGSSANFAVTGASVSYQSQNFAAPSFTSTSTTMTGGTDGTGGDPFGLNTPAVTLYSYDTLGNLLCAVQKGTDTTAFTTCAAAPAAWRPRSFTYDSLSRLRTAKNPESGLITWAYDVDSNVLTKQDARTTITYNYDQLHRVATVGATHAKTYSNGDHAVDYFYDQTSYNGLTIAESVGHQTGMADATGSSASTFDTEGRVLVENQTINIAGITTSAVTKQLSYTYNLDGSNASTTYPDGHTINYVYNSAGHAVSAIDSTGPIKYVTSTTYAPHGEVSSYINGLTTTFNGIKTTNTWNNRFQPLSFLAATLGTGAHNVMSLAFNFNQGTSGAPIDNGLLVKINNNVNTVRNVNYSYDLLNRLTAGWHDAADWGSQYTIDNWGNLSQKAPCNNTMGCPTRTAGEGFSAAVNASNQLNTYSYDVTGNMVNDQLGHTFSYDAENRPYSAGGVTYYYDGAGERAAKSNGKLYWFGTGSAPVAESDASGNLTNEYIFFDGHRVAMKRMSDASVHYYFSDQIGSANVVTNATGAMPPEQDIEYHPYGEQQVYTDTLGQEYRFTGKEHDPETNNDYFGARYYSSTFGRFLTPDWSATPVPIPYASMGNPQTLNLYSYVQNNPITGIDPDGHYNCGGQASDSPCPDQNQAPDTRKDAKKAEEEKANAWLKDQKEKAQQEWDAFRGKAAALGGAVMEEVETVGKNVETAVESTAKYAVEEAPKVAEATERSLGPAVLLFGILLEQRGDGSPHTQTSGTVTTKEDKAVPKPAAAAGGAGGPKPPKNFRSPTNPPSKPPNVVPPGWRVRVMGPSVIYPNGYWKLEKPMKDGSWQPINPSTMKPGPEWETHVPLP